MFILKKKKKSLRIEKRMMLKKMKAITSSILTRFMIEMYHSWWEEGALRLSLIHTFEQQDVNVLMIVRRQWQKQMSYTNEHFTCRTTNFFLRMSV